VYSVELQIAHLHKDREAIIAGGVEQVAYDRLKVESNKVSKVVDACVHTCLHMHRV
jgi:hypothetical protein